YDVGSANIKYRVGFYTNPNTNVTVAKPSTMWDPAQVEQAKVLDYCLSFGMALLTSVFFLLQSFWSFISKSVAKSSFMSSAEFRLNIITSIVVIVIFPTVQFLFRNNHAQREAAPQLAFSAFLLLVSLLGVRTHFRFNSLLKVAIMTATEATMSVVGKLEYFKDLNIVLSGALFGASVSLGIASADGLTASPTISRNKFASDFLIMNVNFFSFIIWVTLVLIFYPRRSAVGSVFGSSSGGTMSKTTPTVVGTGRYNNSKSGYESGGERPPSHVPYKAPNTSSASASGHTSSVGKKIDFADLDRAERANTHYNDTYPLTKGSQQDADMMQMETFKKMYDIDSNKAGGGGGNGHMQSPPLSPNSSRHLRSVSPAPFQMNDHSAVIQPSPTYGSPVTRQGTGTGKQQPATTYVGHQGFVLEEAPGSTHQRAKMALQQQQQQQARYDNYDRDVPTSPTRVRKEPRSPMY
ncbi:hypothetical protein BG004_006588, partial [Podila humilis]